MGLDEGPVSCKERSTLQVNKPVGSYPSVRVQLANRRDAAELPRCFGHSDPCFDHGCRYEGEASAAGVERVRGLCPQRPCADDLVLRLTRRGGEAAFATQIVERAEWCGVSCGADLSSLLPWHRVVSGS